MGCGLGGAWDCFCAGLEGGRVEEGASGGPSLLPTWNRQPEGGCPPRGAEGLNLGQEARGGWGQAGPHPLAGRQVPHPKCWPQVFPGRDVGWADPALIGWESRLWISRGRTWAVTPGKG